MGENCSSPHACSTLPLPGLVAVPTATAFFHLLLTHDFFCITTISNTHTEPSVSSAMAAEKISSFLRKYYIFGRKRKPKQHKTSNHYLTKA